MFSTKNQKTFSLIAGICFAILPLFSIINYIRYEYFSFDAFLYLSCFVGLAVITFIKKKALPFVIVSGIFATICLYNLCRSFYIFNIIDFLIYSTLVFVALINCIPALHKKTKIQKYICFIPSALLVLNWIIQMVMGYHFDFLNLLSVLTEGAALLFAGFWLVDEYEPETTTEVLTFTPASSTPTCPSAPNTIGGADKLMTYKKLLDEGIITQEEFEEKKKKVLDSYF